MARVLGVREVIAACLGRRLGARLPRRAAVLRARAFASGRDLPAFDDTVNAVLSELEAEGRKRLREAGISDRDMLVERTADMRLVGQMHDIAVPLPAGPIDARTYEEIRAAFVKVYSARYTSVYEGARMEAINFRVRCVGPTPALSLKGAAGGATGPTRSRDTAGPGSRAASPTPRCTTATPWPRATASRALP